MDQGNMRKNEMGQTRAAESVALCFACSMRYSFLPLAPLTHFLIICFRHLADKWAKQIVSRSRTATGRNGGSTANNLEGIELMILLDLLGTEKPVISSYFSTTQWAHRHTMSIEQRLWDAKLHGAQILSRKRAGGLEGEEKVEDDMDELEPEEPVEGFLSAEPAWGGIDDDHRPFLEKGVPIFHVIPNPFPHVWHSLEVCLDITTRIFCHMLRTHFTEEMLLIIKQLLLSVSL